MICWWVQEDLNLDLFRVKEGLRNAVTSAFAALGVFGLSQKYRRVPPVSVGSLSW
jgi:hypothetical protein